MVSIAARMAKFPHSLTRLAADGRSPTWNTRWPIASNRGRARSTSAASPPATTNSLAAAAASGLPNTGAEMKRRPRLACRAATSSAVATAIVLIETCTAFAPRPASRPSSPERTDSSAASSASMESTMSRPPAASRGVRAIAAPALTRGSVFPGERFQTVRSWPALRILAAMAAPIRPSPSKPTFIGGSFPLASALCFARAVACLRQAPYANSLARRDKAQATQSRTFALAMKSSVGGPAAGKVVDRAGAERAFAARQPANERSRLLDRSEALHRDLRPHVGDVGGGNLFEDRRLDRGGRNRVDGDAVLRQFLAERLGEADHRRFRSAIGRGRRIALLAGDRGNVDDPPVAARLHQARDKPVAIEETVDVDVEDPLPFGDGVVDDGGVRPGYASAANERVDGAHGRIRIFGGAFDVFRARDVDQSSAALRAEFGRRRSELLGIEVPQRDLSAFSDDAACDRESNS